MNLFKPKIMQFTALMLSHDEIAFGALGWEEKLFKVRL